MYPRELLGRPGRRRVHGPHERGQEGRRLDVDTNSRSNDSATTKTVLQSYRQPDGILETPAFRDGHTVDGLNRALFGQDHRAGAARMSGGLLAVLPCKTKMSRKITARYRLHHTTVLDQDSISPRRDVGPHSDNLGYLFPRVWCNLFQTP